LAIDWQNNSKTKVEKVFFMSSYAEMIYLRGKITKLGVNILGKSLKIEFFGSKFFIGAGYKDKKNHFEIRVKLWIFGTPYRPISTTKIFLNPITGSDFSS
jgi:hypothetical protein